MKPSSFTLSEASDITLNLLGFIAADEGRIERFLALSGMSPQDLKDGTQKPEFLGFLLDYALQDESLILEFAAATGTKPETIQGARFALPGATYDI